MCDRYGKDAHSLLCDYYTMIADNMQGPSFREASSCFRRKLQMLNILVQLDQTRFAVKKANFFSNNIFFFEENVRSINKTSPVRLMVSREEQRVP